MPSATCRCGQSLSVPPDGTERIICPKCGARVRVRRGGLPKGDDDGFIRFFCPCGRRLKVSAMQPPKYGKCPDCSRVVPVPEPGVPLRPPPGHPEAPTEELNAVDSAMLDEWSRKHLGETANPGANSTTAIQTTKPTGRAEAGLRVCPKCSKPVHLGAVVCRACGSPVPKR
jgi:hypothetical protein